MPLSNTNHWWRIASFAGLLAASLWSTPAMAQTYPANGYATASTGWNSGWNSPTWPETTTSNKSWTLGVTGKNTDVGLALDSVSPNSAAARAGLSAGDIVVCVNGVQVGIVGSKIFDIAQILNQHADSLGNVRLLVMYRRTGQLGTVPIKLDDQQAGLTGTLTVQGGSVPANAVITVQIVNVTRPYFVIHNGQQTLRSTGFSQGSIPFTINYDPSYISESDRYSVRAFITYNNTTIFETVQPTYVLTQGNPKSVQLALTPKSTISTISTAQPNPNVVAANYVGYDNISTQVTAAYQKYLGRNPTSMELAAWNSVPDPDYRMGRLPIELMATQEYFDRCGNNNVAWLERAFTEMIGHVPSTYEQEQWMARYAEVHYSRTEVLNQMAIVAGRT
ncbi:YbaY family lipoprotein [Allorhodopirellula solitaria]|uniref:PDZ domain-containing protein n=1 Tax=Allorhodopirellula solitaria TaxID=2527987 RepID=A0A5C5WZL6_9BACT|nr:YbaY family lipoprotein [Allorhodopirellula solitaria]TWT56364.1 hypothetical protein CA85_43670 [Allorhodopirellula solitaria]